MGQSTPEVSKTTDGALAVLEFLGDRRSGTIAEIARGLDLSRTAAYRLLSTLEAHAFVRRTDSVYRLGPKLFALAQHVEWAIRDAAHPHMAALLEQLRETVALVVRDAQETLSVHRVVSRDHVVQVSYPPGLRHHILATGAGKAIAAFAEPDDLQRLVKGRRGVAAELAKIRRRGYAFGIEENQPGLFGLAVPVSSIDGVVAAIVVYTPLERDRSEAVVAAADSVMAAAEAVSAELTAE